MSDKSLTRKEHYIKLFRDNGFNCFPIKHNKKIADTRYDAANTKPDQEITSQENYGIIPTVHNCFIDFDHNWLFCWI